MSTPVAPLPVVSNASTISEILGFLSIALNALGTIPAIGADVALAGVFVQLIQKAMNAYHAASGQPLDLTKIPLETPVS